MFVVICAVVLGILRGGVGVPAGGGGNTAWNSNSNNWGDDRGRAGDADYRGGWGNRRVGDLAAGGDGWTEWGDWDYGDWAFDWADWGEWDTTWSASSPSASAASTWSSWRTWWTNGGWDGQDWSGWETWSGGARERSVPDTHSSGAGEERAKGFYRLGRWVDRARTPEEQRFHDGGQGQQRQSRRQERVRQWKAGTFVPAWKRDMENTTARMHGQSDIDREALRRLLNAGEPRTMSTIREGDDDGGGAPTSGAMPGLAHENRDEISEDRTSCSLSSVGPDDIAAELELEGVVPEPGVVPSHEPRSEVSPGDASELPVPRPDRGEPWQPDGEPCVLPVQPRDRDDPVLPDRDAPVEASSCAGEPRDGAAQPRGDDPAIPAQPRDSGDPAQRDGEPPVRAPRWTRQQWDDWEAWEHKHGNEGDDVNMMQRTAMERDQEEDEADDPPSEGASSSNEPAGVAVPVVAPARPNLCLTLVEQQGLLDAGWPLHHVEHITMFAEYLEDTANQYGIEAVAWGNDGWGDALVMANATVELAQELIWDRLRDVRVVRPGDQAARGGGVGRVPEATGGATPGDHDRGPAAPMVACSRGR